MRKGIGLLAGLVLTATALGTTAVRASDQCRDVCDFPVYCETPCLICDPWPIGMDCPDPVMTTCGDYGAYCMPVPRAQSALVDGAPELAVCTEPPAEAPEPPAERK